MEQGFQMKFSQIVTFSSGATAFLLNIMLLPIILLKSSERIGSYKYFLFAYTLNASLFALSQVSTLPTWYIPPNGYIFQSTITVLPRAIQQIQVMWFVQSYTTNTIIVTWCFLYRLAVIDNPKPWLARLRYAPVVIGGSALLLCYMVASCWPIMPSEHIDELFRETILSATGVEPAEVGYIGGEITIDGHVNIGMAICLGSYSILTFSSSCLVLFCWTKIGSKLRELRSVASLNYRFQYRLYVLLSLQTIMPIIFNIFPAFLVFTLSLAKVPVGKVILVCGMVVSFAQIADPILTVLLVTDYKEAVITWRNRVLNRPVVVPSSFITSSVATPTVVVP